MNALLIHHCVWHLARLLGMVIHSIQILQRFSNLIWQDFFFLPAFVFGYKNYSFYANQPGSEQSTQTNKQANKKAENKILHEKNFEEIFALDRIA